MTLSQARCQCAGRRSLSLFSIAPWEGLRRMHHGSERKDTISELAMYMFSLSPALKMWLIHLTSPRLA
jgi:hypothetical protein